MSANRNHYEVLGVAKKATLATIKKAYHKLAMDTHPDKNPGDRKKEEEFKKISEAYEVLKDSNLRKQYDDFLLNGGNDASFQEKASVGSDGLFFFFLLKDKIEKIINNVVAAHLPSDMQDAFVGLIEACGKFEKKYKAKDLMDSIVNHLFLYLDDYARTIINAYQEDNNRKDTLIEGIKLTINVFNEPTPENVKKCELHISHLPFSVSTTLKLVGSAALVLLSAVVAWVGFCGLLVSGLAFMSSDIPMGLIMGAGGLGLMSLGVAGAVTGFKLFDKALNDPNAIGIREAYSTVTEKITARISP